MEILGVGPSELIFILVIAIIVLGPKDMQKAGRTIGRWLNQMSHSDLWKQFRDASNEISNLPRKWMREANMEVWEAEQDLKHTIDPPSQKSPRSQPKPASYRQPSASKPVNDSQTEDQPAEEPSTPND